MGGVDTCRLPSSTGVARCGKHKVVICAAHGPAVDSPPHPAAMHSGAQLSTELSSGVGRSVRVVGVIDPDLVVVDAEGDGGVRVRPRVVVALLARR